MEWRARSSTRRFFFSNFMKRDAATAIDLKARPPIFHETCRGKYYTSLFFSSRGSYVHVSWFKLISWIFWTFPRRSNEQMIIEFERKRNRSIDLVHHFFPARILYRFETILIKIGATNVKGLFLIRRVLFVEFNEQIRRWLPSSSFSPSDDRYHFGSTLRYNREAFYFILFFFFLSFQYCFY